MRIRLTFDTTAAEELVLLGQEQILLPAHLGSVIYDAAYANENLFLERLTTLDLGFGALGEVASAVLLTVAHPRRPLRSVSLDLTPQQCESLGLRRRDPNLRHPVADTLASPFPFNEQAAEFYDFLMAAPTPFAMLFGPLHCFAFINPSYVELIGHTTHAEILGKPVREALPELEGPFFELLDRVYSTGIPFIGKGVRAWMRRQHGPGTDERYFDFIYHPVPRGSSVVSGILVQATDVTDRVLANQVSESRETQLHSQWVELQAIYRAVPAGIALFESSDGLRLLRVNDRLANLLGATPEALLGRKAHDLFGNIIVVREFLDQAGQGHAAFTQPISCDLPGISGLGSSFLLSAVPLCTRNDSVEGILLVLANA